MKSIAQIWPRQPLWLYVLWLGAIGLFALSLRSAPFLDLFKAFENLQPGSLLILGLLNLAVILLLTSRWGLILHTQGHRLGLLQLTGYRLAAFSLAYFTPGPQVGGEPLQVHLLRTNHGISSSSAIASVSLDKLLELMANFSFLVGGLFILLHSGLFGSLATGQALALALGLLLVPVIYLAALWRGKQPITLLLKRTNHPKWQKATRVVEEAELMIGEFCRQKPLALFSAITISVLTWIVMVSEYYLLLNYLGLTVTLPQAIISLTAARLAFLFPTPGGLGAFEASQVLAAEALGFSAVSGLTVSLVIRARDLLIGASGLWLSAILLKKSPIRTHVYQTTEEE